MAGNLNLGLSYLIANVNAVTFPLSRKRICYFNVKSYLKSLDYDTLVSPGSTQHLLSVPCRRKKGHTNKVERRSAGATNP